MSEPGSRGSSPSQQQTRKKKARKPRPAEPAESEIIDLQHRDYEEMVEMQLASPQTKKNKYRSEEKTPVRCDRICLSHLILTLHHLFVQPL